MNNVEKYMKSISGLFDFKTSDEILDLICLAGSYDRVEASRRLLLEFMEQGYSVKTACKQFGVTPHLYDEHMERMYVESDAYLFACVAAHLKKSTMDVDYLVFSALDEICDKRETRILVLGDAIGSDSLRCVSLGYDVTYFEFEGVSCSFAKHRFERHESGSKIKVINDLSEIPKNFFDIIINREVLEHVPNPEEVVGNMFDYLTPSGKALITESFARVEPTFPDHLEANLRYAGKTVELFESKGFYFIERFKGEKPFIFSKEPKRDSEKLSLLRRIKRRLVSKLASTNEAKFKIIRYKGFVLKANSEHLSPFSRFPFYATNIARLAKAVACKYPNVEVVDVGANIGDTIAVVQSEVKIPFLCIEGDKMYFDLLSENKEQFYQVEILNYFLGEKEEAVSASYNMTGGTGQLSLSGEDEIGFKTIDGLLLSRSNVGKYKLLKIDTDGFDLMVLQGAVDFLKEVNPVLFLEYNIEYLKNQGHAPMEMLFLLRKLGYSDIVFYDNYGRLVLSTNLDNELQVKQLAMYTQNRLFGAFQYYDIAVFHKSDTDLMKEFVQKELVFFDKSGSF